MIKQKQGFKGQRLISVSPEIIQNNQFNPLCKMLYITKIGFFPFVKHHYINKENGVDYYIIIYCTSGKGWCKIDEKSFTITANQYIILPPDTSYSFGADEKDPWSIYWIHFKGKIANTFLNNPVIPILIMPECDSRLQDRILLFEEIYANLEFSFHSDYYTYSTICLFHFLGSFKYIQQFRKIRNIDLMEKSFSERVIYFMKENVENNMTLDQFSKHFGFSPSHFSKRFFDETKRSPMRYFALLKIERACQYLELSNLRICDIYPKLGFQDAAYFSRIFSKIMGVSPSVYKQREKVS